MGAVLITGGSGFLGSYLAEACANENGALIGIDRADGHKSGVMVAVSAEQRRGCRFIESGEGWGAYRLSSLAGGALAIRSMEKPFEDFMSLLPGTARLLEYLARHQKSCHLVLFSSAAVYGEVSSLPVRETAATHPISP